MRPSSPQQGEAAAASSSEAGVGQDDQHRDSIDRVGVVVAGMLELTGLMNDALARVDAAEVRSSADLVVLTTLSLDGPTRPRDMLEAANVTTGGMTNLLNRLQGAGLVTRSGGVADDGRGVLIALAPAGDEMLDRVTRSVRSTFAAARPLLSQWWEQFTAMGHEVGPIPSPTGSLRRELERIRRIAGAGRSFFQVYGPAFGDDDQTPHLTFHVLWLGSKPGGIRLRAISAATRLSPPAATELVARVEKRGLVRRLSDDSDRRVVVVTTTASGRAAMEAVLVAARPMMPRLAAAFFPA